MAFFIDLKRYEEKIREYEALPVEKGKLLLYGSSFFTNWGYDRAKKQLREAGGFDVVNHGFGGSTADELLYYYDRLVKPYAPSALIWRSAVNDINGGMSPQESWCISRRVLEWLMTDFPGIHIGILCVFNYRSAAVEKRPLFTEYDALAKAFAEKTENVDFIDINRFFYEAESDVGSYQHFRDIFVEDGLHLNDTAYEEFAVYFAKILKDLKF